MLIAQRPARALHSYALFLPLPRNHLWLGSLTIEVLPRSSSVFLDSSLARSAFTKIYRNNRDLNDLAQFLIHFSNFEKFYRKFV